MITILISLIIKWLYWHTHCVDKYVDVYLYNKYRNIFEDLIYLIVRW